MKTHPYNVECKIARPFASPKMGRVEVLSALFCKLMILVVPGVFALLALFVGQKFLTYRKMEQTTPTIAAIEAERSELATVVRQVRDMTAAIDNSNYRISNAVMLSRLFSMGYPSDNSYSLDRVAISAIPLEAQSPAPAKRDQRNVRAGTKLPAPERARFIGYNGEFVWTTAAPGTAKVEELTRVLLQGFRPDFDPASATLPWSIDRKLNQQKKTNSEGADVWTNTISFEARPRSVTFQLAGGRTKADRKKQIEQFYSGR